MFIDAHLHTFTPAIASRALEVLAHKSGLKPFTDGTESDTLTKMAECGIDRAISLNITTRPNQEKKVNDYAVSLLGSKLIPFGSINPYSECVESELERLHAAGVKGIKLHAEYQEFDVNDPIAFPIYSKLCELDMIVTFHCGFDSAYPESTRAYPDKLACVFDKFPDLKAICAHMGGMFAWDGVIKYLCGRENIYFDTGMVARCMPTELAKEVIARHGADKILFGTDCPWESFENSKAFIQSLELNEQDYSNIMGLNCAKLLKL